MCQAQFSLVEVEGEVGFEVEVEVWVEVEAEVGIIQKVYQK